MPLPSARHLDPAVPPAPATTLQPPPRRGLVPVLVIAAIGAASAQMSAALLTLTLKATELDAAGAATTISISSGFAGVFTLVALPVVGALSDRSRSRFGRRRPFLAAGAVSFSAGGSLLITAPNVPLFVTAHLLLTLGAVCVAVATTAILADQIPDDRRGPTAAFLSLSTALGALVGTAISKPFGADLVPLVGIPTVLAVLGLLALIVVMRDPRTSQPRTPFNWREAVGVFWVNPVRYPSFAAVFASRMFVFSGVAALNAFQALYLLKRVGVAPDDLGSAILLTVVANAGISLLVAPAIGRLSDRVGRRKPFILVAALVLGAGLVAAAAAPTFPLYLVACSIVALGQGVYFAVELALATSVLPDPDNPAKDLAIVKVADNLPTSIVAAVAPALLAIGSGQNYPALFLAGALSAVVGGVVILRVRGAR